MNDLPEMQNMNDLIALQQLAYARLSPEEKKLYAILSTPEKLATFNYATVEQKISQPYYIKDFLETIFSNEDLVQLFAKMPLPISLYIVEETRDVGVSLLCVEQLFEALMVCTTGIKTTPIEGGAPPRVVVEEVDIRTPDTGVSWLGSIRGAKRGVFQGLKFSLKMIPLCLLGIYIFFASSNTIANAVCSLDPNSRTCKSALYLNKFYWKTVVDPKRKIPLHREPGLTLGSRRITLLNDKETTELLIAFVTKDPNAMITILANKVETQKHFTEEDILLTMRKHDMTEAQALNYLIGTNIADVLANIASAIFAGLSSEIPVFETFTSTSLQWGLMVAAPKRTYKAWKGCFGDFDQCMGVDGITKTIHTAALKLPGKLSSGEIEKLKVSMPQYVPEIVQKTTVKAIQLNKEFSHFFEGSVKPYMRYVKFAGRFVRSVPGAKQIMNFLSLNPIGLIPTASYVTDYAYDSYASYNGFIDFLINLGIKLHKSPFSPTLNKLTLDRIKFDYIVDTKGEAEKLAERALAAHQQMQDQGDSKKEKGRHSDRVLPTPPTLLLLQREHQKPSVGTDASTSNVTDYKPYHKRAEKAYQGSFEGGGKTYRRKHRRQMTQKKKRIVQRTKQKKYNYYNSL
jgi:hypothetical protein